VIKTGHALFSLLLFRGFIMANSISTEWDGISCHTVPEVAPPTNIAREDSFTIFVVHQVTLTADRAARDIAELRAALMGEVDED
jgi:hypothetical protein